MKSSPMSWSNLMTSKLILTITLVFSLSISAFVPTSNFELDQSVITNQCLNTDGIDILDEKNSRALCEIVTNSPACENVEYIKKRQCDPRNQIEAGVQVEFISCLKGIWGSAVEFMKFIGSIIDYIIDSDTRTKKNKELKDTYNSAKHFLAMEWSRAMDETDGWGPMHYYNAAKDFSKTIGDIIYNMLQETYYTTQANYACLNPVARTQAICQFAGAVLIPPTIVMAKIAKYLIKSGVKATKLLKVNIDTKLSQRKLLDADELAKNKEDLDIEKLNQAEDFDKASTRHELAAQTNLLERLDLAMAKVPNDKPENLIKFSNLSTDSMKDMLDKLGVPSSPANIMKDGIEVKRLHITKEDLAKSSTPMAQRMLKFLEGSNNKSLVISPYEMKKLEKYGHTQDNIAYASAKGLSYIFDKTDAKKLAAQKPSAHTLQMISKNYSDRSVERLAKQLNEEGFAVRVIERKSKDPETKEVKVVKGLQFNRYAADNNNPAVTRLEKFRNKDFRQKIVFYPNSHSRASGSSNRDTRTVSFNFDNLEELINGGHTNTVPHEFRHAKFEYNRSKGKESLYDYRVTALKEDSVLHSGRTYTKYFSMEEVYNHSQDIYKVARKLDKDPEIKKSLGTLFGKLDTIENISKGFKAQNEALDFNFMSNINAQNLKVTTSRGAKVIKVAKDSNISVVVEKNGYYTVQVVNGDVHHAIPISSQQGKAALEKIFKNIDIADRQGNLEEVAKQTRYITDMIRNRNKQRERLVDGLAPKIQELKHKIQTTSYSDKSLAEIKELSRHISQMAKGRNPTSMPQPPGK